MYTCVMHTSIIRDPDTCVYDGCIHDAAYLSCMDLDSDAYIHDACMHDAYTYAP